MDNHAPSFQELIRRLTHFWQEQKCTIHQGYDLEVGAGTLNPTTFLRCLGPEPYRAAYIEPCRRPADGRYGENPNRVQHYFQLQVILKPSPLDMQALYLQSLKAVGIDLSKHDIRFVHDDWENPTIGAWGLGWEVWLDGMEVTQYTYFQSVGGIPLKPITGELTYGLERLAIYLQGVDNIFDIRWNGNLTYGDIYHPNEVEWSRYNFEEASTEMWRRHFDDFERESKRMVALELALPAYEFVMKASHAFNLLDARGVISVAERTRTIARIRELAHSVAKLYLERRKLAGHPLTRRFPSPPPSEPAIPPIPEPLLNASANKKVNFLLEIGSEELPAAFAPIGAKSLAQLITELLSKEGVPYQSIENFATPRRLACLVHGLSLATDSQVVERRGPPIERAFDATGAPTEIALGFFRSIEKAPLHLEEINRGKEPSLTVAELKGREYLFAKLTIPGKVTAKLLAAELPKLIQSIAFPKTMRWADLSLNYARPIRWIVALLDSQLLPFAVGPIHSGQQSYGHAQLDPASFFVPSADQWLTLLKAHLVLADPEARRAAITEAIDQTDGEVLCREQLLSELIYLTEWPQCKEASFEAHFLKAPKEVLISEMVKHQKYFPIADREGTLKNRFILTADTSPTQTVVEGNQKVLSARLADGVFLYEKSVNVPLDQSVEKLKEITFMGGLGSLFDKTERMKKQILMLIELLKTGNPTVALRAAYLAKADLCSEMVGEFPDLQGVMGRTFAIEQGEDPEVATAIEEQWMPLGEGAALPKTTTGAQLSLTDKIDNLLSCFATGKRPTSSSDPYALRRQAIAIAKILIDQKWRLPLSDILSQAASCFDPPIQIDKEEILSFLLNRVRTVFLEYGMEKDEIEATLSRGLSDVYDSFCRIEALHRFRSQQSFSQLCEVYKRAKGQLTDQTPQTLDATKFVEPAEKGLFNALQKIEPHFTDALATFNYDRAYHLIAQLQPPLSTLFDEVKILAENNTLRNNRIALLQRIFALFGKLLDFSKIKI